MKNLAFIVATGLITAAVYATPLLPGGSVSPLTYFATSVNAATVVQPITVSPFAAGLFSGTLYSAIVTNDVDNPYGAGMLSFIYVLQNNATSTDALGRFSVNGFGSFGTDVGMDPFGIGTGQIDAFENTRAANGDSMGWTFLNLPGAFSQVNPGQTSSYFIVHTNATTYSWNTAAVIDGAIANANAWSPAPTPGALALLSLGLFASARRRTR